MKMKCLLADDEPLARKGMENFIQEIPFLELKNSCSNAFEVMDSLANHKIDLVFLDIQMPKMSGTSLLKIMPSMPLTIITTAHPDYAVESFELEVIDYLLKPIPFERFVKAVHKAKELFELRQQGVQQKKLQGDFCFIKCNKSYEKIFYNDILFIEGLQNYVVIYLKGKKYISYLTLKGVEDQLPPSQFVKVNKSTIVNLQKIRSIEGNEILLDENHIAIGRAYKDEVLDRIINQHLLKR